MDTLHAYLNNMFLNLPQTPNVLRAKQELGQMMEDKYLELKHRGYSENEAVGQTIAEFGDLQELKHELGLQDDPGYTEIPDTPPNTLTLTQDQARGYIERRMMSRRRIALAVAILIMSPVPLMVGFAMMPRISENTVTLIGLIGLFVMVVLGIMILILDKMKMVDDEGLERVVIHLDTRTRTEVAERMKDRQTSFVLHITAGIILILIGVIVLIGVSVWQSDRVVQSDPLTFTTVAILIVCVAVAVALFIHAGMERSTYELLLNRGEYTAEARRSARVVERISGPFWLITTAIYLAWSFTSGRWGVTWIVWPIAGIIFAVMQSIISAATQEHH